MSLLLLLGGLLFGVPARADTPPNVVLIVLDACREDEVDATRNGEPVMPHLSSFSAVRFRNAVSAASWTRPSIASVLTSLYVDTHQIHDVSTSLPANLESAASYLKEAGYKTLCVQASGNVSPSYGFNQGFDVYDYIEGVPSNTVTSHALALTESVTEPFFLYAHYMAPHGPYWPPESYRTLMGYPDPLLSTEERAIVENFSPYAQDNNEYLIGYKPERVFPELSSVGKDSARTLYDSNARFADEYSGLLVDTLLASYPNTVVIILADHGEHFWEHGFLAHVLTVYEQLVHVPLFIKGPGLAPATVDSFVQTVDILPTIAALAGLPARSTWQGRDLFAPRDPLGPVFSCGKYGTPYYRDLEMVRLGSMKLICDRNSGGVELYDLDTDPGETTNLASVQPAVTDQLTAVLYSHLRQNARANGSDGPIAASPRGSPMEKGSKINLTAGVGASYRWFKDGQLLEEDAPHVEGTDTCMLTIYPLETDDAGEYECLYTGGTTQCLKITNPFTLQVFPANSLPGAGPGGLMAIMVVFVALACFRPRSLE